MPAKLTDREVKDAVSIFRANGLNMSAAARLFGVPRPTFQRRIRTAVERGFLDPEERRDANVPTSEEYLDARSRKLAAFARKKRKGDWRKPVLVNLTPEPFRLKIFGDPHLDSDGCDYALFEKHWLEMDVEKRIFGVCVGDFFDNWLKALSHLWKETTTPPSDAWLCLEWLMEQRGECLIAACSGNHDDWSHGPADPVDLLMKKHGVLYRKGAIRIGLNWDADPMFWAIRHKWQGRSIYSPAHWVARANREGWRDALLIGGHIHQDEPRLVTHPDGFVSHGCQVSAFKMFDEYADVHGFNGPKISPVWDLVIDPQLPETSPDRIKIFWDIDKAQAYLESIS